MSEYIEWLPIADKAIGILWHGQHAVAKPTDTIAIRFVAAGNRLTGGTQSREKLIFFSISMSQLCTRILYHAQQEQLCGNEIIRKRLIGVTA